MLSHTSRQRHSWRVVFVGNHRAMLTRIAVAVVVAAVVVIA